MCVKPHENRLCTAVPGRSLFASLYLNWWKIRKPQQLEHLFFLHRKAKYLVFHPNKLFAHSNIIALWRALKVVEMEFRKCLWFHSIMRVYHKNQCLPLFALCSAFKRPASLFISGGVRRCLWDSHRTDMPGIVNWGMWLSSKKASKSFSLENLKLFIYSRWQCGVYVRAYVSESEAPVTFTQNLTHFRHVYFAAFYSVGAAEEKRRKRDAEWEKYLISCYTQSKK